LIAFEHFKDLKRQARVIARRDGGTVRDAQNELARAQGYSTWGALTRRVPTPMRVEVR
jgi:hypothetical protein